MAEVIDFYEEFGLDRGASAAQIQQDLRRIEFQLNSKVSRSSSMQERWKRELKLIERAKVAFQNNFLTEKNNVGKAVTSTSSAESPEIDWTVRAWNYSFVGNQGAALDAAQKAKAQAPGEVMAYVVSASVLLQGDDIRAAKQDIDEAFVLDDFKLDAVDVQTGRGAVWSLLGDNEQALKCFELALPKASSSEKADLFWRKALIYLEQKNYPLAYYTGLQGLSTRVELPDYLQENLEKVTSNAINYIANQENLDGGKLLYETMKAEIAEVPMFASSRAKIIANIEQNIARLDLVGQLQRTIKRKQSESFPSRLRPKIGWDLYLVFGLSVLLFFAVPPSDMKLVFGALILLPCTGFYLYQYFGQRKWDEEHDQLNFNRLEELANATNQLNASPPPTEPIWL
jgi:tetratricopeptide (TPR) repeat protein